MRIAHLDACAGISGDMLLGALLHAGVPAALFRETLERLAIGATLRIEEVDRSGIGALKVDVLVGGRPAEEAEHSPAHAHEPALGHAHGSGHVPSHGHGHDHDPGHGPHPGHDEARSLRAIRRLIDQADLGESVKRLAIRAFDLLGAAEAAVHRVPVETIHFHEVGSVDAIADIVLAAAGAQALGVEAWHCSPLNVGGGTVRCAHGVFPVPAPATAELLKGAPTYGSDIRMELTTPTGAALVRALGCTFGAAPPIAVSAIGYGAGSRNPAGFANVLRLSVGETAEGAAGPGSVTVIETAVDDLNPQVVAHVMERALKAGALDAMCTPVLMKKGRQGTLLTLLAEPGRAAALQELLLAETSTLGVRMREERRVCMEREHVPVATPWGVVRVKVGRWNGREMTATPEFEDCRAAAETAGVPVKQVIENALLAYRKDSA